MNGLAGTSFFIVTKGAYYTFLYYHESRGRWTALGQGLIALLRNKRWPSDLSKPSNYAYFPMTFVVLMMDSGWLLQEMRTVKSDLILLIFYFRCCWLCFRL